MTYITGAGTTSSNVIAFYLAMVDFPVSPCPDHSFIDILEMVALSAYPSRITARSTHAAALIRADSGIAAVDA
ncbi:hypothetical protein BD413DRAFT_611732 [Trametes elegans]|nr:hypothetical protein BD413DRAFT_611732 [Trametes elegans]